PSLLAVYPHPFTCARLRHNAVALTSTINYTNLYQGIQYPIRLRCGIQRFATVQWWLCRGSLVYRSCGNHSQLQHTLRANCNGHDGRLKRKYSIADSVRLHASSLLYSIGPYPSNLGRRSYLHGQRSIRLSRNRIDQLRCDRQSRFEREGAMGKRPAILDQLYRRPPHMASRPQQTTDGGYVIAGYTFAPASIYNPFVVKPSLPE